MDGYLSFFVPGGMPNTTEETVAAERAFVLRRDTRLFSLSTCYSHNSLITPQQTQVVMRNIVGDDQAIKTTQNVQLSDLFGPFGR